jgi:hypothetical protein
MNLRPRKGRQADEKDPDSKVESCGGTAGTLVAPGKIAEDAPTAGDFFKADPSPHPDAIRHCVDGGGRW